MGGARGRDYAIDGGIWCPLQEHPGSNVPLADRDEGGGDDVDGSVVVVSDGGNGECGVEMISATGRSWPEVAGAATAAGKERENGSWRLC
ncbi:hypothetical protein Tco_1069873 [Tanacetum coccineum]|uniref:Uncharacterized protein n=1 Tax=Tanacetum coccineum TaxID=301880 RepID=A0ABQ5HJV6_9ASTR